MGYISTVVLNWGVCACTFVTYQNLKSHVKREITIGENDAETV